MSTWKKYGGIHNVEHFNHMSVYSFVADVFTLRQSYYGTFDISGELHVNGDATSDGNIRTQNLTVANDLSTNNLYVNKFTIQNAMVDISGNLSIEYGNVMVGQNMDVSGRIYLENQLVLGNSMQAFLFGSPVTGNIGINTLNPIATVDISSSHPLLLNAGSNTQETVYSVPVRNQNNRGIILNSNTTTSQIDFYNDSIINPQAVPNGFIQYASGGYLTIDVSNNTTILSTLGISNRLASSHILGETVIIYDVSAGIYLPQIYQNTSETTGSALSLIANDSSSNTFMHIVTPNKQGISIGGGVYPNDQTRSMGTIGWRDANSNYTPTMNIVSGASKIRKKTTVGINTHAPLLDSYTFDINGPVRLNNGELTIASQTNFEILELSVGKYSSNYSVAIGSPYTIGPGSYKQKILYTSNSGETWLENYDLSGTQIENTNNYIRSAFVFDSSLAIIAGDSTYSFYSYNGGIPVGSAKAWQSIVFPNYLQNANYSVKSIYINISKRVFMGVDVSGANSFIYWFDLPITIYQEYTGFRTNKAGPDGSFNLDAAGIKSMDGFISGSNTGLWISYGTSNIALVNIDNSTPSSSQTLTQTRTTYSYKTVNVFSSDIITAGGINVISTSRNGGVSWSDISLSDLTINKIYLLDSSNGLAVGNSGTILVTTDGGLSWSVIPTHILNSSGNANRLIDASYNLTNIGVVDSNNFYVVKNLTSYIAGTTQASTSLFHAYLPNMFNNSTNYVLDASGSARVSGDMNINDGGKIASNNATFNLLNNGVNQVNFAGDASFVYIASKTNSTVVVNSALNVLHDLSLNGNLYSAQKIYSVGDISSNGQIYGINGVFSNYYEGILSPSGTTCDINIGGFNYAGLSNRNLRIGNFSGIVDTSTNIYLGGPNDQVIISSSVISSQNTKAGPLLYLNYASFPNSSYGSGIHFGEDGNPDTGLFIISNDRSGFIFKPSDPSNTNIVKFDVKNVTLPTGFTTALMGLQPSTGNGQLDSSYTMVVSSIDPSNLVILNKTISSPTQQVIDTSFSVMGPMSIGTYPADPSYALELSGGLYQPYGLIWQF